MTSPAYTDVALIRVSFTNLIEGAAPIEVDLPADADTGWFRTTTSQLGLNGWWQADVLVRHLGVEDVVVSFYLLIPDPNVNGISAVRIPHIAGREGHLRSRSAAMTSWNSVHFTERLGGGSGTYSLTNFIYHDVSDGQPAAMRISRPPIRKSSSG